MQRFDAIIIGTGQAGPSLAARLVDAGMKVAVIERGLFGGTCVNTGCVPTKALIASAYAAHLARRAGDYGLRVHATVEIDMKAVKVRKDAISRRSREGIEQWMRGLKSGTVFQRHARFLSPREVAVGEDVISAERIFVNVGGRASVPAMTGLDRVEYFDNSSMMTVDFIPEHLLIVGGSYIGLEFAQMYRRFGSEVTVIEMQPRLIAREDEDVSEAVAGILEREGVGVRRNAKCLSVDRDGSGLSVGLDCVQGPPNVKGSHLLLAVGRRPNTDDLGLDKAGVGVDKRGYIQVDDELRTSVEGIWALGDCNGKGAFTHTSYNDYEIVAANLLDGGRRRVSDRIDAYALYVDPPLGRAGMTERQVRERKKPALIATRPMTQVGRAVEKGETQGFMKILVDADDKRLLGASILGVGGDEVIHSLLDLMYAKAPYTVIQCAMHIHPTVSELLPTMLNELVPLQPSESPTNSRESAPETRTRTGTLAGEQLKTV
jgi:pyruvate/2-oxoglutarate dehydrogenase complex dihydrolipoamide dehydrogenase (E3) component